MGVMITVLYSVDERSTRETRTSPGHGGHDFGWVRITEGLPPQVPTSFLGLRMQTCVRRSIRPGHTHKSRGRRVARTGEVNTTRWERHPPHRRDH
jgi:hypothetical protein